MKKSLVFLFALISFAACDLTKLEPAQTKSFMKYFGDVGKTYGEDVLQLDDGYLLLGNNYASEDRTNHQFSVLIKTDLNGNTLWTEIHNDIEGRALAGLPSAELILIPYSKLGHNKLCGFAVHAPVCHRYLCLLVCWRVTIV